MQERAQQQQQAAQQQQVAQQQAIQQQAVQQEMHRQGLEDQQQIQTRRSRSLYPEPTVPSSNEEVGDLQHISQELQISSEVWPLIVDQEPKEEIIQMYIDWYRDQGITIQKPSSHYVKLIDSMMVQNPGIFKSAFKDVMKFMAIIEYDFDNGMDKDRLALQLLGQETYEANKKRLGL